MTPNELIEIEKKIADLWDAGEINALTHLSGGNEQQLIDIFDKIKKTDWVLVSHRAHYHYLLHGGEPERLIQKVIEGKSMFLYREKFIQSSIVAGLCTTAVGLAMALKMKGSDDKVFCFVGDGAEEQGAFYESVKTAHDRDLPVWFIIEDNNRQCGVSRENRQSKPFTWPGKVMRYHYTPTWPHAGTGSRPNLKNKKPCRH